MPDAQDDDITIVRAITLGTVELTPEEKQRTAMNWTVTALIVGGILLVLCSEWLGEMWVQDCGSNGPCSWDPIEAHSVADTFRCLGLMVFIAGIAERVLLVVRGQHPSAD